MSAPNTPPIIIIKKKGGHGGHHGGAWKVAYADFVTAMMAFFIVMWLLSASQDVQKAIAGYFRDPKGYGKKLGSSMGGSGQSISINKSNVSALKDKLEQAMHASPQFEKLKDYVQMTVTGEGLRIELLESEKGTFFESGQPIPTELARDLLVKLAGELGNMKNSILIEGHTDSKPFAGANYSNWELSTDRANAARKIMQEKGLRDGQVAQIRGFADQQLRLADKPEDPSNRRVSIIVQYLQTPEPEPPAAKGGKEGEAGEGEGGAEKKEGEHEGAKPAAKEHSESSKPVAAGPEHGEHPPESKPTDKQQGKK